jgi:catechol 2,3-dioxygenase-like lactoylglutathione lyase family enzyme
LSRGLDHIVHAVRDLDAAVDLYRRLGFQVGARNRHPGAWGTQNHIVQLPGTYIELLGIADASGIAPHAPRQFSFGAFNRDFLERGQGLSMLVLEGRGAPDADEFRDRGIGDFTLFEFEREGKHPDGTPIKLAFTLAFASDLNSPQAGFFTSLHRHPENFWNPAFQQHANGADSVAGVVAVAEEPARHRDFLLAFTGAKSTTDTANGFSIELSRGQIELTTPSAFERRFGLAAPDTYKGLRLAALRFAGRYLTARQEAAMDAMLLFEPSR